MSTMSDVTSAEPSRSPEAVKTKTPRSFSVSLHGPDDSTLRITAILRKDATAVTYAVHSTKAAGGKRHNVRGATEKHASAAGAKTAVDKLVTAATKLGWVRKAGGSGFRAKPDAFTVANLPAAKPSKK